MTSVIPPTTRIGTRAPPSRLRAGAAPTAWAPLARGCHAGAEAAATAIDPVAPDPVEPLIEPDVIAEADEGGGVGALGGAMGAVAAIARRPTVGSFGPSAAPVKRPSTENGAGSAATVDAMAARPTFAAGTPAALIPWTVGAVGSAGPPVLIRTLTGAGYAFIAVNLPGVKVNPVPAPAGDSITLSTEATAGVGGTPFCLHLRHGRLKGLE